MAIIRITKKQIQAANKARAAALLKDHDFRHQEEQLQRLRAEAIAARQKEQPV